MQLHSLSDLLYTIIASLFLLGTVTLVAGIIILLTRSVGKDMQVITKQTNQLAKKGMVDDLSGLVGNASALLTASSQMVRTTAGVGLILILFGLIQIAAAIGLILYLQG